MVAAAVAVATGVVAVAIPWAAAATLRAVTRAAALISADRDTLPVVELILPVVARISPAADM
jgi:hypothetical protein